MARPSGNDNHSAGTPPVDLSNPLLVGLTGGIATGKSTVAAYFSAAGVPVIDADRIARRVVQRSLPAWKAIVAAFGPSILDDNDDIDRARLAAIVFNDPGQRERLNHIVHPRVYEAMAKDIEQHLRSFPGRRILLDIPLLIETGLHRELSLIILVYAPESTQIQRLIRRDKLSEASALARVRAQMPIESKRAFADILIDNSGHRVATRRQVLDVCRSLRNDESACDHRPKNPP
jgi:dephospho-CoA kinase